MKIHKLKWALMLMVLFAIGILGSVTAQIKKERKVEIKNTTSDHGESIHLRIEKEDGSIYERTYSNKEEMQKDPELQDLNLHFMFGGDHDNNLQWITTDEDSVVNKKVMKIKSDDGGLHESFEDTNEWIYDLTTDDGRSTYVFHNNEGDSYKILRREDGKIQIEKDGVIMDIEDLQDDEETKVEILEDGTIIISDGNEFRMDYSDDFQWELDSLQNEFFLFGNDSKVNIKKSDDGKYIIKMEVEAETDREGNGNVFVTRMVEKIQIEILDIMDESELSEVPGIHLNEGRNLKLDEVEYYPNPSEGQFNLKFRGKEKPTQVKILDMTGTEVYNEQLNNFQGVYDNKINLTGNEPGLYVLQVIQNDRSWTKKIVIE